MTQNSINLLKELKKKAGNHSPSRKEISKALKYDPVKIDSCFLSNPYATELIYKYGLKEKISNNFYNLIESYPPNQYFILDKLSMIEKIDPNKTIAFNGAQQGIEVLLSELQYKDILLPIPTYSSYYEAKNIKSNIHFHSLESKNSFEIDFEKLNQDILEKRIDLLILINPNNPTGKSISTSDIKNLIKTHKNLQIIIDDSFSHFLPDLQTWINEKEIIMASSENVYFVKSLSKDYGIAGFRIGYVQSNSPILKSLKDRIGTWVINNFAVECLDVMADDAFLLDYEKARLKYLQAKDIFYKNLRTIDALKVFNSDANFYLAKIPNEIEGFEFVMRLLIEEGIYIRSMSDKVGLDESYIRIASRSETENKVIFDGLRTKF
jgi:histidinol-phosphate/aromatic aminotransferase/cobyric acid decarboxylase-like protein